MLPTYSASVLPTAACMSPVAMVATAAAVPAVEYAAALPYANSLYAAASTGGAAVYPYTAGVLAAQTQSQVVLSESMADLRVREQLIENERALAVAEYGASVWPPPPLPPIDVEVSARIRALESQRSVAVETREVRVGVTDEEVRVLLERKDAEWRVRVDVLERRLEDATRQSDRRISELLAELEVQKSISQRTTIDLRADSAAENEDLRRQRDQMASDLEHLKKACALREQEAKDLRAALAEERNAIQLLYKEMATVKAEYDAIRARTRIDSDVDLVKRLSASFDNRLDEQVVTTATTVMENTKRTSNASQGPIDIDLRRGSSRETYAAKRNSGLDVSNVSTRTDFTSDAYNRRGGNGMVTTTVVEIEESVSSYSDDGNK